MPVDAHTLGGLARATKRCGDRRLVIQRPIAACSPALADAAWTPKIPTLSSVHLERVCLALGAAVFLRYCVAMGVTLTGLKAGCQNVPSLLLNVTTEQIRNHGLPNPR
jgi:hypothetical protein